MRLVPTKINASLLLDECYFEDGVSNRVLSKLASDDEMQGSTERRTRAYALVGEDSSTELTQQIASEVEFQKSSNIDDLVAQACTEQKARKQLALLSRAAKECDKFHSYFHFEESFFHFTLGIHCESLSRLDDAIEAYKKALVSYPMNKAAYAELIKLYESCSLFQELEILAANMKTRGLVLDRAAKCNRPFSKFEHYVAFATNKQRADKQFLKTQVTANNFWLSFAEFEISADINILKETIARTKRCHASYHDNAALIFYNCALVYECLGDAVLASNMMLKAKSLNPDCHNFRC